MDPFLEKQENNISIHVFSVSAGMVGACLTVVSIINVITSHLAVKTLVDDITAWDALVFLFSCALSYFAMKTKDRKRRYALERVADGFFLFGLTILAIVCVMIVISLGIR